MEFKIRASYPNYYMMQLFASCEGDISDNIFAVENKPVGNKPGTVIYRFENESESHEIAPRWYDIYYLLSSDDKSQSEHFLNLLIKERDGDESVKDELGSLRNQLHDKIRKYVEENPLHDDIYIVTTLSDPNLHSEQIVSNKGKMLLALTKECYAVPDFCILTSKSFCRENQEELLRKAIRNLEIMTQSKLGDDTNPLVFAMRSAMPQYIPGLMPTLLNIGMNRTAHKALVRKHGPNMANRIYLNNLNNMFDMLGITEKSAVDENKLTCDEQNARIEWMEAKIIEHENGDSRLLDDCFYQVLKFTYYVRSFYLNNKQLVMTFMRGKKAYPSLILHKMVWTIGNDSSCPGVLYSRNSNTGTGRQIETYPDIFGEEIMTGNISARNWSYSDRKDIKEIFPAVYHFDPLLENLERKFKSPVTIEFGIETIQGKASLFAVLQLNRSELTGRAALMSSIEMLLNKKISEMTIDDYNSLKNNDFNDSNHHQIIERKDIIELIRPYHLRQLFSDTIDDKAFSELTFFGKGVNVLPRTATTAKICFSSAEATKLKGDGFPVCICKQRFTPEDTITLNEVDAIMSITPAAIHVVTACRGYGIPAFLNLGNFGMRLQDNKLINAAGKELKYGEWITLSSKRRTIYEGRATFKPARFRKFLNGENISLNAEDTKIFNELKLAYTIYQDIINSSHVNFITDIDSLARLISYDLNTNPQKSKDVVNTWYNLNPELYQNQVLESKMGSHLEQSRVFEFLDSEKKVDFFKSIIHKCKKMNISGLDAGSFMLGRFIAKPLPKSFWETFTPDEIAFMLNEYVLYEKYLAVLQEVGETKLMRTHKQIISQNLKEIVLQNMTLYTFVPLIMTDTDWDEVECQVNRLNNSQDNTLYIARALSKPLDEIFDMSKPWIRDKVTELSKL
ncbi:MAG: hypothetical protein MJ000_02420 [Bacteroidales bacterium]|nr:hypothetical protein [Bacteroidales bacterium]